VPTRKEIEDAHKEFWHWIFRVNDGSNHPLKLSNNGRAQTTQHGSLLIVAGSLPDSVPRNRLLQIPAGIEYIFVPGENCVYTMADNDGQSNRDLLDKANQDMTNSRAKVLVNSRPQQINRLAGHTFSLDIQKCITGAGKSGRGEGCTSGTAPGPTNAAAACDYAIIPADSLGSGHTIKIEGIGRAGPNQQPGTIDVTYRVQ
jgi:hypothetical protein